MRHAQPVVHGTANVVTRAPDDAHTEAVSGSSADVMEKPSGARTGAVTVVLADDSDVYRRGMRRAIEADARLSLVAEVADGAAALAAIRELQPDVVLLDLQMPALDGVEVCCRVQADPPPRLPRFVLVSAFLSEEVTQRARACGMDHQLDKTTPRREICDVLAGADSV
jgi:two-component system, NarL family, nitrate/nitrite response regulator NarL